MSDQQEHQGGAPVAGEVSQPTAPVPPVAEPQVQPVPGLPAPPPGDAADPLASVLDRLQAERDARLEATGTEDFEIPTWGGTMVATYGHLGEAEYDRYVAKLGPNPKPSLSQAQDILIASVKSIAVVDAGTGDRTEIADGFNRKLCRRLARIAETATAREIVLYMMGGRAMHVAEHAGEVIEFLQGGASKVEDELTGESATS